MGEIRVLDKQTAELIAAGEVIDRPASVVKELLENSVDAGAKHITIEIKNGGIELIRVTDDGKGIAPEDAETAFLRHATSKVRNANDLNEILTLGFRGEALASICAVSKVSMITRQVNSEIGCHIEIAGGELVNKEEAGCPVGTTIIVKNIFFNTPARMKFLKKDVSEANAVAAVIEKIAVSNPHISFKFIRDGKIDLQTVGDGKLFSAIHCVYGKSFSDTLIPVDFDKNGVKVKGFISKALNARAKRSMQFFFLNGRTIKNITMTVALEEAYKGSIMVGKFPACILMVEIAPSIVDVNVHPTKTEVRFSDERVIYDAVYFACKSAISSDDANANITFKEGFQENSKVKFVKQDSFTVTGEQIKLEEPPKPVVFEKTDFKKDIENITKQENFVSNPFNKKNNVLPVDDFVFDSSVEKLNDNQINLSPVKDILLKENQKVVDKISKTDFTSPNIEVTEEINVVNDRFSGAKIIGEIFKTYILLECEEALYLVDKHAAHERLIYNKLRENNGKIQHQYLMEPVVSKLSRDEYDVLLVNKELVFEIGFDIDDFGSGSVIIRSVPPFVAFEDAALVLGEIASNLLVNKKDINPQIVDDIYHRIACRSAVKANDKNSKFELEFLIDCLRKHEDVKYCPHGRPVTVKLTKTELEKKFGRI